MADELKPPTDDELNNLLWDLYPSHVERVPVVRRLVHEVRRLRAELAEVHTSIPQLIRNDRKQRDRA